MAKVNEQPKLKPPRFQIIEGLSSMLVSEFGEGLQFDNYLVVADKIGEIFLVENSPSVLQRQSRLRDCWNAAMVEFNAETLLVDRLLKMKSGANFFGVILRVWRIKKISRYASSTAMRWRSSSSISPGVATVWAISSRNND